MVIGKENQTAIRKIQEGTMVLTKIDKYNDDWPQVAKVQHVCNDMVTVTWYKGWTGSWIESTKPVPGNRGKRMPWQETIQMSDIWFDNFSLTANGKLPTRVKQAIDRYH